MKKIFHPYVGISLAFLILACSVPAKTDQTNPYGSSDANGSYGDSGDSYGNPGGSGDSGNYGGDANGSYGDANGSYGYGGSSSPSYGDEKTPKTNYRPNTSKNGDNPQSPSLYGGNEQTPQTNPESPSQYAGNEQTSGTENYGSSPSVYDSKNAGKKDNYDDPNGYGYDTNGSGGSYGGSSGTNPNAYGSPSAPYQTPKEPAKTESSEASPSSSSSTPPGFTPISEADSALKTPPVPPSLMTAFAVDIHFVAGYDLRSSYIAFHYCSEVRNLTQCAIYNGEGSNARLIAVEMVVTEDVFKSFPEEERHLWHSHEFAVLSGIFVIPGLSPEKELDAMKGTISSYGKVTNFYHPGQNTTTGVPQLAYGWTTEEQINEDLVKRMERMLGLTTTRAERVESRKGLKRPTLVPGHDNYLKTGIINEYDITSVRVNKENGEPLE